MLHLYVYNVPSVYLFCTCKVCVCMCSEGCVHLCVYIHVEWICMCTCRGCCAYACMHLGCTCIHKCALICVCVPGIHVYMHDISVYV